MARFTKAGFTTAGFITTFMAGAIATFMRTHLLFIVHGSLRVSQAADVDWARFMATRFMADESNRAA